MCTLSPLSPHSLFSLQPPPLSFLFTIFWLLASPLTVLCPCSFIVSATPSKQGGRVLSAKTHVPFFSLSLVARGIYAPSTNYCSSYVPRFWASRGPFLTTHCPQCESCSPWSPTRTQPAGDRNDVFPFLLETFFSFLFFFSLQDFNLQTKKLHVLFFLLFLFFTSLFSFSFSLSSFLSFLLSSFSCPSFFSASWLAILLLMRLCKATTERINEAKYTTTIEKQGAWRMTSFLTVEADSGLKEMGWEADTKCPYCRERGCPSPALLQWEQHDPKSQRTSPEGSHKQDSLPISPVSLLPPQQCQQPLEKMDRKEMPPEHQSLKISFETLLQRCALSATDLVSLNLPHDAPFRPQLVPGSLNCKTSSFCESSYCPWTCCL